MHYQPKSPQDMHAPEWARWKARDNDGTWHWFECRPRWNKHMGVWSPMRGETTPISVLGKCCYGGSKPKKDCASCGAWSIEAPNAKVSRGEPTKEKQHRSNFLGCNGGLGLPTTDEQLVNAMQINSEMVKKYSNVCCAFKQECLDADELLRILRLDPKTYRTECGYINMPKVRAALANPDKYPMIPNVEWK